jgi:hypothetical protein
MLLSCYEENSNRWSLTQLVVRVVLLLLPQHLIVADTASCACCVAAAAASAATGCFRLWMCWLAARMCYSRMFIVWLLLTQLVVLLLLQAAAGS